ncbi:MAG TPA: hypothetical protein VIY48_00420 [Candidatus Paceibacterota bacterium]
MTDEKRELRIKDLGQQINESWDAEELKALWAEMRGLILQRSPAQVQAMEKALGLQ